jgi:hypothetical protein
MEMDWIGSRRLNHTHFKANEVGGNGAYFDLDEACITT